MRLLRQLWARHSQPRSSHPGPGLDPALHDLKQSLGPILELLEKAPVGVMVVGSDLRLLYANAHQVAMHGYSREELLSLSLPDLVAPERRANIPQRMAQVRSMGGGTFDSWHVNKAGERLHLSIMVMPIVWDGQEAVISVHANLTELDRSNAALQASEALHRSLTERSNLAREAAQLGIWDWDIAADQLSWDDQMFKLYGLEPGSKLGGYQAWRGQVHPEDRAACDAASRDALDGRKTYDEEFRVVWPDGSVHYLKARAKVLRDALGVPQRMIGVNFDISARKVAEMERAELMTKHLEAQKLEAIGSLAGGVAHDFNNMLSVILGYAEVLKGGLEEGGAQQQHLQEIEKAAAAAAELTQQLLAFGRKQVLRPVPLDLNRSVAEVERMLRRVLGENIRIDLRLAPGLGLALADSGQIVQVLMNLMINARDAMPGGGLLQVTTANVELSADEAARHQGLHAGPHVSVEVADSGTGMDAATKARIWEPFFTTKGQGKGTGLGLPTVYGIVKQSRGDIWVDSSPGQGSRFCILLPRVAESSRCGQQGAGERLPLGHGERVLLVEDERPLRGLITKQLEASGYQVLVAEDAESALALAADQAAGIDLLLTDVLMPGPNGVWLADRMAQSRPSLRVLFISGYADDALQELGEAKRNLVFLGKPFNLRGLALKVREALDGPPFLT